MVDSVGKCRDIKLENIFIGADGRVKLGDFGLTMSMKQEVAISPVGTVEYMAPEVIPYLCNSHCVSRHHPSHCYIEADCVRQFQCISALH